MVHSKLNYPFFSQAPNVTRFKKIVLRNNGGNFGKGYIEDPMMQSLVDDRNMDYQKYRPVIVFINGKYFGLHQLIEPSNHDYVYSNYGLEKDQIDFFDYGGIMKQGTPEDWQQLIQRLKFYAGINATKVMTDAVFQQFKDKVDIYNFIDYMAFEIYINNTDWPYNNCRYWRERSSEGRWRWLIYDVDFGFGNYGYTDEAALVSHNTLAFALENTKGDDDYPNGSDYTYPLRAMLQNQTFKEDFINRFATLLATNFNPERVSKRIDKMANEIKDEVSRDQKRWDISGDWTDYLQNMKDFANERPAYIYRFIGEQFGCDTMCTVEISSSGGIVTVNDMPIKESSMTGTYFTGVPLRLKAIPEGGRVFKKWSDGNTQNPRRLTLGGDVTISPVFE